MEWEGTSALLKWQGSSGESAIEVAKAHQLCCLLHHNCMVHGMKE